jgi:mono/diheme cytochrome c family protein
MSPWNPFIMANYNAYVHSSRYFGGKPRRFREVQADFQGHLAELLAKCPRQDHLNQALSDEDQQMLLEALRDWGGLDAGIARGTLPPTGGIRRPHSTGRRPRVRTHGLAGGSNSLLPRCHHAFAPSCAERLMPPAFARFGITRALVGSTASALGAIALTGVALTAVALTGVAHGGDDASPVASGARASLSGPAQFEQTDGESLYRAACQACHMPEAQGGAGAARYPALAGNARLAVGAYPIAMVLHGSKAMPGFAASLSDPQVAAVVSYVRTHFGNHYPHIVTADQVKTARAMAP